MDCFCMSLIGDIRQPIWILLLEHEYVDEVLSALVLCADCS
jgi:hypothetical protein